MITNLVICFFSSLALFCDCSACIHQQFKGCSLKFVLYHSLLLHLTWFCRRASKRKLLLKSDLSFLVFTPLFPSCSPSKVFSLHTGKGKSSFFSVSHWIVFCFLFFWFFIIGFPGVSWLSFSPYVKINKKKSCCSFACWLQMLYWYFINLFLTNFLSVLEKSRIPEIKFQLS